MGAVNPARPEGPLYRSWVLSCGLGEFIGIGCAGIVALAANSLIGEPDSPAAAWTIYLAMVSVGAVEGGAIGFFQWRILQRLFPNLPARHWIGATVAVAILGWASGMLPSTLSAGSPPAGAEAVAEPGMAFILLASAGMGAAGGLIFGFAQWLVLRRHTSHAVLWLPANILGWAIAMMWIFLAATWPDMTTPPLFIALSALAGGAAAGLSIGAVTGIALLRLARQ
ncbi:hypothetical protein SZ64_08735 [Erythrobacter sp. SG61-1L]|uniref:hypothetical protein n=1 Tax=Erythrobacter sp. SG61-1L TaxID=1603897 RepID=UPI0006C8FA99|nr:hypothetical protein [Erythrobacter sp. SG61-1L]KPL68199.1 hypothetical protein SZ64_08735 [Erythrobacter sp. SG61-1L]